MADQAKRPDEKSPVRTDSKRGTRSGPEPGERYDAEVGGRTGGKRDESEPGGGTGAKRGERPSDTDATDLRRRRQGDVRMKGVRSIERLRDRVEVAAHELKRLRSENEALLKRIEEMESAHDMDPPTAGLPMESDPEILKRKITGFIEAIDRYLERERKESQD